MSQNVTVTITAKDQASQAFQAVGKSAGGMASSVQQSAKGIGVLKSAFAGLASGAAIGFLSDSARAAAEAEISQTRLRQAVENTGKSFDDLQPSIDAAIDGAMQLAFDDEKAADALATLTTYTGDASEAMDLLSLSMDIARGRGVDLETAAKAVGKAAEGNVGALTRMGVAVEEGATAQEALAAAQARFAGQAEAYSSTAAASADRLRTAFGNFQETIGGLAGPMTGIITLLPGMSAGFSALGGAIGALKGAGGFAGLMSMINPVGLAIAGLAVTIGVVTAAFISAKDANEDFTGSLTNLNTAIGDIDVDTTRGEFERLKLTIDDLDYSKQLGELASGWMGPTKAVTAYNDTLAKSVDATQESGASIDDLIFAATKMQYEFDNGTTSLTDIVATLEDYNAILNYTGDGQDIAAKSLADLTTEYAYGKMTTEEYAKQIGLIVDNFSLFDRQARSNAAAIEEQSRVISGATDKYGPFIEAQKTANQVALDNLVTTDRYGPTIAANTEALRLQGQATLEAAEQQRQYAETLKQTFTDALIQSINGVAGAFQNIVIPGEDILDVLSRIGATAPNVNDAFADMVDGINDSAGALDSVLSRFATLDQLGARSESAVDVAQKYVGDPGVYAVVDDLLAANIISLEKYNQLQNDEIRIVEANNAVQQDLNLLRMNQVDDLAAAQEGYAGYIDSLTRATETEQTHALYLMESGNQAKVASAYSTAYAASLGEIPQDVATEIIANAAMADPVLKGILEDYGLISQGETGTVTINFPDESAQALNRFESMFGEGNVSMTANGLIVVANADGNELVYDQFGNLIDKNVTATINTELNDTTGLFARGGGGVVANDVLAMALPDTETTVTVNIDGDTTTFEGALAEAQTNATTFASTTYTTTINGDRASWDSVIAAVRADASVWADDEQWITTIGGNRLPWDEQLSAAMTGGETWASKTFVANIDGDRTLFDTVIADLDKRVVGTVFMEVDAIDQNGDMAGRKRMQLGGTVRTEYVSSVADVYQRAQLGRTIMVGEAGPELAILPYGTQVMPSGASESRANADSTNGGMRFYGPVHIHAASPNIAREIERQMTTRALR